MTSKHMGRVRFFVCKWKYLLPMPWGCLLWRVCSIGISMSINPHSIESTKVRRSRHIWWTVSTGRTLSVCSTDVWLIRKAAGTCFHPTRNYHRFISLVSRAEWLSVISCSILLTELIWIIWQAIWSSLIVGGLRASVSATIYIADGGTFATFPATFATVNIWNKKIIENWIIEIKKK